MFSFLLHSPHWRVSLTAIDLLFTMDNGVAFRAIEALFQGGSRNTEDLARLFEQCSLNLPPQVCHASPACLSLLHLQPSLEVTELCCSIQDSSREQDMSFSQTASMEHDHQEPSSSSAQPSNQHDPILAVGYYPSMFCFNQVHGVGKSLFLCSICTGQPLITSAECPVICVHE